MSVPPSDFQAARERLLAEQQRMRARIEAARSVPTAIPAAPLPEVATAISQPVAAAATHGEIRPEKTPDLQATQALGRAAGATQKQVAPEEDQALLHRLLKDRDRKMVIHGDTQRPRSVIKLRAAIVAGIFAIAAPFVGMKMAETTAVAVGGVAAGVAIQQVAPTAENKAPQVQAAEHSKTEAEPSQPRYSYMGPIRRGELTEMQELLWSAIKQVESNGSQFDSEGNPLTSRVGAIGISQMMPETAREAAEMAGMPFDEARYKYDTSYNEALGVAYFKQLYRAFDGDPVAITASYNMGPGATSDWVRGRAYASRSGTDWRPSHAKDMSQLPDETRNYIQRNLQQARQLAPSASLRQKVTDLFERAMPQRPIAPEKAASEAATQNFAAPAPSMSDLPTPPSASTTKEPQVQVRRENGSVEWVSVSQYRQLAQKGEHLSFPQANTVSASHASAAPPLQNSEAPQAEGGGKLRGWAQRMGDRIQEKRGQLEGVKDRVDEIRDNLRAPQATMEPIEHSRPAPRR